jgi:hypothetical protein
MQQNIQNIQTIQNTLHETKNVPPSIKKVYSRSLQSLQAKFEMFQNALRIEAEKSGYPLNDDQRNFYTHQVQELQKKIYGEPVSSNAGEVKDILSTLHTLYDQQKANLTSEEV